MSNGQYKIHGRTVRVMVKFTRNTESVDEHTCRKMGYLPDFDSLPWAEDFARTLPGT